MPKTDKERRMAAGVQVPVAGADPMQPSAKPPTDKTRLAALRSKKRGEAKALMSRSPRVKPTPRKHG